MRKGLLIIIAVFIGGYLFISAFQNNDTNMKGTGEVTVRSQIFAVEIADTVEKQAKGLSERDALPENRGMVFLFTEKASYPFWMKGMRFPLDIIWISDGKVVGVHKNLPPDDSAFPELYYPPGPIDTVFEINAGIAEAIGIQEGDKVEIRIPR
ncbi:MAG: DUF192 domain-containing protein [Patescibacteria group bacterium]